MISIYIDIREYSKAFDYCEDLIELNNFMLNDKEKNLFMISSKGVLNILKTRLDLLQKKSNNNNPKEFHLYIPEDMLSEKIQKIRSEIKEFVEHIISIVSTLLDRITPEDIIGSIFYSKLKADYMKYNIGKNLYDRSLLRRRGDNNPGVRLPEHL